MQAEPQLTIEELRALVRTVPDFPQPGIQFRDITTLIGDGPGLSSTIAHLATSVAETKPDAIAGMEARGFIFGAAVAAALGVGFIPIRKPGKLPGDTVGIDYQLEYGTDRLEMAVGAIQPGNRVAIVDDLIATGGTALAAVELMRGAGGLIETAHFVIDLPDLGGAERLRAADVSVSALMSFDGD